MRFWLQQFSSGVGADGANNPTLGLGFCPPGPWGSRAAAAPLAAPGPRTRPDGTSSEPCPRSAELLPDYVHMCHSQGTGWVASASDGMSPAPASACLLCDARSTPTKLPDTEALPPLEVLSCFQGLSHFPGEVSLPQLWGPHLSIMGCSLQSFLGPTCSLGTAVLWASPLSCGVSRSSAAHPCPRVPQQVHNTGEKGSECVRSSSFTVSVTFSPNLCALLPVVAS